MLPIRRNLCSLLGVPFLLFGFSLTCSHAQKASAARHSNNSAAPGRNTYNASCAGCHGLDGHGSDKAINIAAGGAAQHLTDAQLSGIISSGVPGTGMPAFHNLSEKQIRAVIQYLRSLQGKTETRTVAGDAKRGKETFFGKGECSLCHTISGQGGFLGPDLSAYGSSASADALRDEITKSPRNPRPGYRWAVLTTREGDRIEGLIRNEDNFSVQFQAKDGSFHFFQKSELRNFDRRETSLMPTDYRERLTSAELDDLVSFLLSASPDAGKAAPSRRKKEEEEDYE
jgi:putative heme-binding domain-containing protein